MAERKATKDPQGRSWFIVCPNIRENGVMNITPQEMQILEPDDICDYIVGAWAENETKQAACLYCKSKSGMEHLHIVLCSLSSVRFSTIQNFLVGKAHLELTKGTKKEVVDYIEKRGKFAEKGEVILAKSQIGELCDNQGKRTDYEIIREAINKGLTWKQVRRLDDKFFKPDYTATIKSMYFDCREMNTPYKRKVSVHWYLGDSGSGKTGVTLDLVRDLGEDMLCLVDDYKNPFDKYCGEPILVLDEFRGQIPFAVLLGVLDGYKKQVPARYNNVLGLWSEVYITTIASPEQVYKKMMEKADEDKDPISQLLRRLTDITYCYKVIRDYSEEMAKAWGLPIAQHTDDIGTPCDFYRFTISAREYKELRGDKTEALKELAKKDYLRNHHALGDICPAFDIGTD